MEGHLPASGSVYISWVILSNIMFWVLPFKTISLPYYYRCWVTTIDVARIFRNVWIRPRGPRCTRLLGGHLGKKGAPLAINMGPILLHGDLAGEWVLIVGPWHLQVLSWLQDASAMATPTWQVRGPGRWGGGGIEHRGCIGTHCTLLATFLAAKS